jgi:hypothetical protein
LLLYSGRAGAGPGTVPMLTVLWPHHSIAAPLTYNRVFVERGGVVYFGFRTKLRHDYSVRPNAPATDALFARSASCAESAQRVSPH